MFLNFLKKCFGQTRAKKSIKASFLKTLAKRKKLDYLQESGDYDTYLSVLNSCIDELDSLSVNAQSYRTLYKSICSELSMLNFKRDIALDKLNRISVHKSSQSGKMLKVWYRPSSRE
jgi:hypothetical protein